MVLTYNKIKHCISVANYMYSNAHKYNLSAEDMYIVGLLHDIGYLIKKEGHAGCGANLLKTMGMSEEYTCAIANHGENLQKLEKITPVLLLLVEADLQIDYLGNYIGFQNRLKDIQKRYGTQSKQYQNAKHTIEYLERNEARKNE